MTLHKMIRGNLIFVLIVLAFNLLFFLQQQNAVEVERGYEAFNAYIGTGVVFLAALAVLSFIFCLFSFPGAGFSLSLGGYFFGLPYLPFAAVILFLSTWADFPFAKLAKRKSSFFRKLADAQIMGESVQSGVVLSLLRMNPAVPFLFFAAFYEKKPSFKLLSGLFLASVFHSLIYVVVGWNIRSGAFDVKSLSIFTTSFMLLSLLPVILIAFYQTKLKKG